MTDKTALILGATGGAGQAVAQALSRQGWAIRALSRDVARARAVLPRAHWLQGDAMNARDVCAAAMGTQVIFHAVNPPGYRHWRARALPMLDSTIAAAKASGARIAFPGNVYNYGLDAFPLVEEGSPQTPHTKKGAVRVEMERRLRASGARAVILRAGDFFGPASAKSSWLWEAMISPGKPVRRIIYPGAPNAGHSWAYLPDYAETLAQILAQEAALPRFDTFHFEGHWLARGGDFARAVAAAAGVPDAPVWRFPWGAVRAASLFGGFAKELNEMRYLWYQSLRLDNAKLTAFLGAEPRTDLQTALRISLAAQGCVAKAAPAVQAAM